MTSLFDVGKSAIQAYRQSLAVTGQNIANINTDGYVRREADLKELQPARAELRVLQIKVGSVSGWLISDDPLMNCLRE